jgi:hypothetical protein
MNAPFLCKLTLEVEAFASFLVHDLAVLGAAIGQTQTLHELHLMSSDAYDRNQIGETILMHLGSHAHHLRTLRLSLGDDATTGQFRGLASALCSAQRLSHVQMEDYIFDLDSMGIFWRHCARIKQLLPFPYGAAAWRRIVIICGLNF